MEAASHGLVVKPRHGHDAKGVTVWTGAALASCATLEPGAQRGRYKVVRWVQRTSRAALECVAPVAGRAASLGVCVAEKNLMTVAFLFVATAASLLMSPRSHPRARACGWSGFRYGLWRVQREVKILPSHPNGTPKL